MPNFYIGLIIAILTTAIAFQYEVIWPVLDKLYIADPEHDLSRNKPMANFACFMVSLLFAPVLLPITLIPSWSEAVRNYLFEALIKD